MEETITALLLKHGPGTFWFGGFQPFHRFGGHPVSHLLEPHIAEALWKGSEAVRSRTASQSWSTERVELPGWTLCPCRLKSNPSLMALGAVLHRASQASP